MLIERRSNAQNELRHEKHKYGRDRPNNLQQYPRQRQADRFPAKGDQAEDTIDTSLQVIRDQCETIAKLDRGVDRHDDKAERCNHT